MYLLTILFHYLRTLIETHLLPPFIQQQILNYRKRSYFNWLKKNSPYYRQFTQAKCLEDFPIIDKSVHMDNFDLINTKNLNKEKCYQLALASEENRDFSPMIGNISVGLSSGTSGNRGLFCASPKERALWAGIIIAKLLPGPITQKHKIGLFLRASNNLYNRLSSKKIIFKFFDMIIPLKDQLKNLSSLNPDILVAPSSVLCELAKFKTEGQLEISPSKVISVAEVLDKADEEYLSQVFNQKIHQIYQCTEGFLGATCSEGFLHINEESIIIEKEYIDKESGRFVPIITDLFRKTQPIVRYRLNDILVEDRSPCPCGSKHLKLKQIEGREDDIFLFKQEESFVSIYPDFLRRAVLKVSDDIKEYKVVQLSYDQLLIELDSQSLESEDIKSNIQKNILSLLERNKIELPQISFDEIIEREKTAKRKRVERKFKREN